MTARPDEVVAWQYLYLHRKGARWVTCEESEYNLAVAAPHEYETRALTDATALQSANARLADVLALADELEALLIEFTMGGMGEYYVPLPGKRGRPAPPPGFNPKFPTSLTALLIQLRRAAAGEGDANQGDGK